MKRRSRPASPKYERNFPRIRQRLLCWFGRHRRMFPWRETRDPYAIWIAETMLQQTRSAVVMPYYRRFLGAIPTLEALDRAPLERVLALWSGLGYYRRAKNLKRAAAILARGHGGKFPEDFNTLRSLPGIGDYTAGALMSIVFSRPVPALDGNARRVLKRVFNIEIDGELRECAARLIPRSRPGPFNQALMELGSRICSSIKPRCPRCPIARDCAARAAGRQNATLSPLERRKPLDVEWPLIILRSNGRILMRRKTTGRILNGLWEVPGGEKRKRESRKATLLRHLGKLAKQANSLSPIGTIRHRITYRRITSHLYFCPVPPSAKLRLPDSHWRWLWIRQLHRYPISSLSLKALSVLKTYEDKDRRNSLQGKR